MVGEWRDSVLIPKNSTVVIEFTPRHYGGESLVHCHVFAHSDTGMGFKFELVDEAVVGGDADERGCRASAGQSWCEPLGECIRTWETECDGGIVGGDADKHGCRASAGYSWCEPLRKCVRIWETEC